jgi:hypothetical protein
MAYAPRSCGRRLQSTLVLMSTWGVLLLSAGCGTAPPASPTALASVLQSGNPGRALPCFKGDRPMVRPGVQKVCLMDRGRMTCMNPC